MLRSGLQRKWFPGLRLQSARTTIWSRFVESFKAQPALDFDFGEPVSTSKDGAQSRIRADFQEGFGRPAIAVSKHNCYVSRFGKLQTWEATMSRYRDPFDLPSF